VDFSGEVFPRLLEAGRPLYGWITDRYWEDVGTLEAYLSAHEDVLDEKVGVELDGFPLRHGVWIGEGAEIDPTATIDAPVLVGDNCRVGPGARIGPYCVLGANVRVGESAEIQRSVVHDNSYLGAGVSARGSVIGRSCELRQGVHLDEGVVVGDSCRIGAQAVVLSGVKIYPHKIVEAGATVTTSIIWESRGSRSLFGRNGVTGLANVDLSPELAVRVAMAYATALPKGSTVTTSRDSSRAARVLKRAAMVGLNAAGLDVEDLEAATVPVTRFHVRRGQSRGGVTVRLDPDDPQSILIRFLDGDGNDLDEAAQRKIERLYHREESRRVLAAEIGDIEFPPRTAELYTAALVDGVDRDAIRQMRFKLVLDYAFGTASFVMPSVLAKLGSDVLVVNPVVSTPGVLSFDREVHANRIAGLVRSSGAHLGAVISPDGEQLTLVDDTGHVLAHGETLLAFVDLVATGQPGARITVPINVSSAAERVCARLGAKLSFAKLTGPEIEDLAGDQHTDFAGDADGGFAFPEFLPAHDAVASLVHLLDLLASQPRSLSSVVAALPSTHVAHQEVPTAFDQKGAVMRSVLELARDDELVLVDGVKRVDADGWTLVVPDPDRPVTHVYAEAGSLAASDERARRGAAEIREILGRP
jgi:mannose-1-phosphate guanylyltransferase/phosphomannomutase